MGSALRVVQLTPLENWTTSQLTRQKTRLNGKARAYPLTYTERSVTSVCLEHDGGDVMEVDAWWDLAR